MSVENPTLEYVVQEINKRYSSVIAIYVFGSFGTKLERKDSDLDIAVLFQTSPDSVALWEFAQEVAIALNRDIDLIDLEKASTVFRYEIVTTGKRIYCSNEVLAEEFECLCWKMYIFFNEERRELIGE